MSLKSEKGFIGVDISIALMIFLILMAGITGMIYNINKENNSIKRKSQALNFAISAVETAKGIDVSSLEISGLESELNSCYTNSNAVVTNTSLNDSFLSLKKDSVSYNVELSIVDYNEIDGNIEAGTAKQVTVNVT